MTLFVDTSVWSLALRRDAATSEAEVQALKDALLGADTVVTAGRKGIRPLAIFGFTKFIPWPARHL